MNFLITGGAGSVGRDLTAALLSAGHRVRVLDKSTGALASLSDAKLEVVEGRVEDARLVRGALQGVDVAIHLAWSFSDDPVVLLESDLRGHLVLLDACADAKVNHLFYASSAVVYGKPVHVPISEEGPCLAEEARKPFYAIAKLAAEKLALTYGRTRDLPVTVFRFWWSYGEKIGGRHLRDLIALARAGKPLPVPEGAGGSFLDHDDLAHALQSALQTSGSIGQTFNLATVYLEWRDIAQMIIHVTGSAATVDVIPAREWKGAQFLADPWKLSTANAEHRFGYRSLFSPDQARQRVEKAIYRCHEEMNGK